VVVILLESCFLKGMDHSPQRKIESVGLGRIGCLLTRRVARLALQFFNLASIDNVWAAAQLSDP
jgi:hypothetical protein